MDVFRNNNGCAIDINTLYEITLCENCQYKGITNCTTKRLVDLFRKEESIYLVNIKDDIGQDITNIKKD